MKFCTSCRRCFHGRTAPTSTACECGNGCFCSCPCEKNRARMARDDADHAAHQRAAYEASVRANPFWTDAQKAKLLAF